jgi:hypothetical protein
MNLYDADKIPEDERIVHHGDSFTVRAGGVVKPTAFCKGLLFGLVLGLTVLVIFF